MTDVNRRVSTDRERLAETGALLLGPPLADYVNRFTNEELATDPDRPLDASVLARWRRGLFDAIGDELFEVLVGQAVILWATRGLPVPDTAAIRRDAALAVRATVAGTDNIAQTLASSAALADGSAPLADLLDEAHQAIVGSSLTMTGTDQLYDRLANAPVLTGRRRWLAQNPETSRHGALNGQIAQRSGGWTLDGGEVSGPRDDPADVALWSNCSCSLEYETEDGEWL